jgi:hypothetical protein
MVWQRECCLLVLNLVTKELRKGDGEGGSEGREFADPLVTVVAKEVVPRVRSKEKGDLLIRCERDAGKGIVGEEVGEDRDYHDNLSTSWKRPH